jgi:hypothetical protein
MNQDNQTLNKHGGARPGAGRPKGSSNKIRIEDLIDSIESRSGMSFTDQVASNYIAAIVREDWARVENYDKALLNKVVADKNEIVVEEVGEGITHKVAAFREAIEALTKVNSTEDINNTKDTNNAISKKHE